MSAIEFDAPSQRDSDLKRRRALGIYYTPAALTEAISYWAVRTKSDTALEPSFGGCPDLHESSRSTLGTFGWYCYL
jgi:adenine-specific DNA-methyltransferase